MKLPAIAHHLRADLPWALAYPLYQTLGTLRHEGAHALAALFEGARVTRFVFWPTLAPRGGLRWGYVRFTGRTGWFTLAAPYLCDLLTYALGFWLCTRTRFSRRWLWLNVVIVGLISPLANSLYNYVGGHFRNNDVGRLLAQLPPLAVEAYFVVTLALYVVGLVVVFKERRAEALALSKQSPAGCHGSP